jgi:xanthine dehydrogenase iron-sulfur cluster and FAD-binding subunit A
MVQSSRLPCCFTQCGFCTPGFLITMLAFLTETPEPDEPAVREALSAHPCFCAGYRHIVDRDLLAARRMAGTR